MTYPLPPRSFCLIRHGETTANRDSIIAGRLDVSLTPQGRAQARALQNCVWPKEFALFTSRMERAQETCALGFPQQRFQPISDLRERDWGVFEGEPLAQLPPRDGRPAGGEDWQDMINRVGAAIARCCDLAGPALPIMVCHSGVIRAARILAGQSSFGTRPPTAHPIYFNWSGNDHQETPHVHTV